MQKVSYFEVTPGGNTTAIVPGSFRIQKRQKIALKIIENNRAIEQVGFWMPSRYKQAAARLEMAGGEFCGNAARSLAALLGRRKPYLLEVSGLPSPVLVEASKKKASITIPLKTFNLRTDICTLPGITHVLKPNMIDKTAARNILGLRKLLKKDASGVIGYKKSSVSSYRIEPVVWVRDLKTLFAETACASGTMALAYFVWKSRGINKLQITQPSGAVFTTQIKNGQLKLRGPILKISKKVFVL